MSITIHGAPLSPFVRKVRVVAAEKGLSYDLNPVVPFDLPEGFERLNPLRRIPAFEHDGNVLADSSVICRYIEGTFPESSLVPADPYLAARVGWFEKYGDYELAQDVTFVVFRNRVVKALLGEASDEETIAEAMKTTIPKHFDYLNNELGDNDYFVGDSLTLADLSLATQLVNFEHGGEKLDAERWPQLVQWFQRVTSRKSFADIVPDEVALIEQLTGKK